MLPPTEQPDIAYCGKQANMFMEARMSHTNEQPVLGFSVTGVHQASAELLATQHKLWSKHYIQYDQMQL